jgi:hypothetical protein
VCGGCGCGCGCVVRVGGYTWKSVLDVRFGFGFSDGERVEREWRGSGEGSGMRCVVSWWISE